MERIAKVPATAEIIIISAITSAFPPATAGAVPDAWNGDAGKGCVPEFTVDVRHAGVTVGSGGANGGTAFTLYGGEPVTGVIPDTTFTAATTDICTAASHGFNTGDGPVRVSSSGTLPAGLAAGTDYWVIWLSANTFSLASSRALAFAGTAVDITSTGSGTHTLADIATTQIMQWRNLGVISSAPTINLREGVSVVCEHDPRYVAYGVTWTGGTTNAAKVTMVPRGPR